MTHVAVADPEFHIKGKFPTLKVGMPNYCLAIFSRKVHGNKKKIGQRVCAPVDRQLFSFTLIS